MAKITKTEIATGKLSSPPTRSTFHFSQRAVREVMEEVADGPWLTPELIATLTIKLNAKLDAQFERVKLLADQKQKDRNVG